DPIRRDDASLDRLVVCLTLAHSWSSHIFAASMKRRRDSRLTVLSAFTGAGGLDVGLELAGFRTIACIENNAQARQTIELNRSSWNLFEAGDINTVTRGLTHGNLGLRRRQLSMLAG